MGLVVGQRSPLNKELNVSPYGSGHKHDSSTTLFNFIQGREQAFNSVPYGKERKQYDIQGNVSVGDMQPRPGFCRWESGAPDLTDKADNLAVGSLLPLSTVPQHAYSTKKGESSVSPSNLNMGSLVPFQNDVVLPTHYSDASMRENIGRVSNLNRAMVPSMGADVAPQYGKQHWEAHLRQSRFGRPVVVPA